MNTKDNYKFCGFYDMMRASQLEVDSPFPYLIYAKDNQSHICTMDPVIGNINGFWHISGNNPGIIARLTSDIEKKVGDRNLFGYRFKNNLFLGEREDIIELASGHKDELREDALCGKDRASYIECLMFAKLYEECANFYKHLISVETHDNMKLGWKISLDCIEDYAKMDSAQLIPNKPRLSVYALDLGNVTKGLEKRYIEPKYLKELQQNNPEFFA